MNKIKKTLRTLCFLALTGLMASVATSCDDMLTVDTGDKTYQNANDTLYSYLGILKHVQDIAERQVLLGELRGDLVSPTAYMTDTLYAIANFENPADGSCSLLKVSDYYAVINNCNLYLAAADTAAVKNNEKYMLPEYAQVMAIRAWTYLQLVQNYGEVPYLRQPIASLDVVKNFDYDNNLATKDNLVDLLLGDGLLRFVDTEYPNYGTYNNGAISFSARLCFLPIRLILADLYLLRGASQEDYLRAARYYYQYLRQNSVYVPLAYCSANLLSGVSSESYSYSRTNWGQAASQYTYSAGGEVISSIPSSANKQFGTLLTRVADIFGYTTSSTQSTETDTNDDGEEEVSSSGAVSVTPNPESQTQPSPAYQRISKAQTYVYWNTSVMEQELWECGDTRFFYATQSHTDTDGQLYRLASKAASRSTFYYAIPLYRKTVVWLRLAEALNRAGFPQHAFAILKDGLNANNYPDPDAITTVVTTHTDAEGNTVADTTLVRAIRYNTFGALHYVDSTELADCPFDFTDDAFTENYGIHARGCGIGTQWASTVSSDSRVTNLTGYNDTIVFDYAPRLLAEGVDVLTASQADIINAVENVIADELALEAAFEGYRFPDLVRMAHHKDASGHSGAQWLAALIADRQVGVSTGERDQALYAKLIDPANWYLTLPAWGGK